MFQFPPLPPILPEQRRVVLAMAAAFALIEIVLQGSDIGLYSPYLRYRVYEEFAFYNPWFQGLLLGKATPPQLWWSLLTHAFLHGGMTHMVLNTGVFLGLGFVTMRVFGTAWFLVIFVVSAVAGALMFGLLSASQGVLVGASGALFGLIGALKMVERRFILRFGGSMSQWWKVIWALVFINVVLAIGLQGLLAWQAHLGGFLGGWAVAWAFTRRRAEPAS